MKIVKICWWLDGNYGSWPLDEKGLEELPIHTSRRLSPLGRKAVQIFNKCTLSGNESIPWVISCRDGDISRRFKLLANLAQQEMLSPIDFSMSVHNAIVGFHSISSNNKQAHTALAAGENSLGVGLLESIALLVEKGGSVGYVYYDNIDADLTRIICLAVVFSAGSGEISFDYKTVKDDAPLNSNSLKDFMEFLNGNEKRYRLPIAGGEIHFERNLSEAKHSW
jgi:hypothetical protein